MLAVTVPAPLRPTLLAVGSCTRQHANLLVLGQIVSDLVFLLNASTLCPDRSSRTLTSYIGLTQQSICKMSCLISRMVEQ
jgi:hypothetical protein